MRRMLFVLAAVFATAAIAVPVALADSPHFLFANSSISSTTGALTVNFKEVGLGTGTTSVTITLNVQNATAVYQCFNNGGKHPKAGNKETVSTSLQASGTFPVSNGQTTASLSVGPPSQGDFACPSGQSLFLQSVTYSGITVTGTVPPGIASALHPIRSPQGRSTS